MEHRPDILAVDDDCTARTFLAQTLSSLPVSLHLASSCGEFSQMMAWLDPSLYLIDVELPDGDGFALAELLCRRPGRPIVFLGVHAHDSHRLRALQLGAVDYLQKPIHPRELTLRIRNLLAELGGCWGHRALDPPPPTARRLGAVCLDLRRRRLVDANGGDLGLTAAEFDVLAALTAKPHVAVTRQEIAQQLGPQSAARHNPRIVDILIWRLRRKLASWTGPRQLIATVPSRGYMFVEDVAPAWDA